MRVLQGNVFQGKMKVFLGFKGDTWAGTIEKSTKNDGFGHTKAILFLVEKYDTI